MRPSLKRPKSIKAVPVLLIVLVMLVVLGFYPDFFRRWVLDPPLKAFRFALSGVTDLSQGSTGLWSHYLHLVGSEEENRRLRQEVETLRNSLQHDRELFLRSEDLKTLLDLKERIPQKEIACHVIADNPTASPKTLLLDCGKERGVRVRDGVIGTHGVVGYVVRVFSGFSQVLWIEDPMFALEGRLQDSGQNGLVRGRGTGHFLRLEYIPSMASTENGVHVVTTGEDGFFPPDQPIGTVVRSGNSRHQLFQSIRLESAEKLHSLYAVMVLVPTLDWTEKPLLGKGQQ